MAEMGVCGDSRQIWVDSVVAASPLSSGSGGAAEGPCLPGGTEGRCRAPTASHGCQDKFTSQQNLTWQKGPSNYPGLGPSVSPCSPCASPGAAPRNLGNPGPPYSRRDYSDLKGPSPSRAPVAKCSNVPTLSLSERGQAPGTDSHFVSQGRLRSQEQTSGCQKAQRPLGRAPPQPGRGGQSNQLRVWKGEQRACLRMPVTGSKGHGGHGVRGSLGHWEARRPELAATGQGVEIRARLLKEVAAGLNPTEAQAAGAGLSHGPAQAQGGGRGRVA